MKVFKSLVIAGVLALSGCTNVIGDVPRSIHLSSSAGQEAGELLSVARDFFSGSGYQCHADEPADSLRCSRPLRDLYIHQTTAVVRIYSDDDATPEVTLVTTRWDEGLIPSEFISDEFHNPDVEAFCEYVKAQALGVCQTVSS